ncbi:hypothetical protein GEMRC1_009585 [Eukaryota sp. GEM-RC1]
MNFAAPTLPDFDVIWRTYDDRMGWFFQHKNQNDKKSYEHIVALKLFPDNDNVECEQYEFGYFASIPAPVTIPAITRSL